MSKEMETHLEHAIADFVSQGLSPEEARRRALREFGSIELAKDEVRDTLPRRWLGILGQDVHYALRGFVQRPGFAITAVTLLALGIGANVAIFQLLDAVRLRSLPVRNPEQLAAVSVAGGTRGFGLNSEWNFMTYPLWEQFRDHQQSFSSVFAWAPVNVTFGTGPTRRAIRGAMVSGLAFETLGIAPERGRLLSAADDSAGCSEGAAVISHSFWLSQFGGAESVMGTQLIFQDAAFVVAGVTPPEFTGLEVGRSFDVAIPFCAAARWPSGRLTIRNAFWLGGFGRLKLGVTAEQAAKQLESGSKPWFDAAAPTGYSKQVMERWEQFRLTASPDVSALSRLRGAYAQSLWLLLGLTGLVLLTACANLANLMLARSLVRAREIAVRMAIGASRARVLLQLLTESLLLAIAGGAAGVALAMFLARVLVGFLQVANRDIELSLVTDWRVALFTLAATFASALVFGLSTAFHATRARGGGHFSARGAARDRGRFSLERLWLAGQIAISLVLVVGSVQLVRSFRNLFTLDTGFRQEGVAFFVPDFRELRLAPERVPAFKEQILASIRSAPGVSVASTTTTIPLSGSGWGHTIRVAGQDQPRDSRFTWVSSGYFEAMGVRILAGRDINRFDTAASRHVALVNETFVKLNFPGVNPIGRTVTSLAEPEYPQTDFEIVGIVKDARYSNLRQPFVPIVYAAAVQHPLPGQAAMTVVTRSTADFAQTESAVRKAIAAVSPQIRVATAIDFRPMVTAGLAREQLLAWLSGFFGLLALVLAAVGLYGVVALMVSSRKGEVGVRLALGASRGSVLWLFLRQVLLVCIAGLVVGGIVSVVLLRTARSLLFGLNAVDPLALVSCAACLAAIALLAALVPARTAAATDLAVALRTE